MCAKRLNLPAQGCIICPNRSPDLNLIELSFGKPGEAAGTRGAAWDHFGFRFCFAGGGALKSR
jgi:hypothetical protein